MKTVRIWSILVLALSLLICPAKLNAQDRIYEDDSEVEVIDTGDGYITFVEDNLERMRLSSGRLGIGTTTPAERIHVYGGNLMVENHETTVSFRGNCYSNLNRSAAVYFYRSRGTKTAPLAITTNDAMGFFGFVGYDGTSYSSSEAYFKASADGPWSSTSHPTHMLFATCAAGSTTAEPRLFVDDTGYIGIGTVEPSRKLEIEGSSSYEGIRLENTGSGGGRWDILSTSSGGYSPGGLTFWDATDHEHRMLIDTDGHVGIGTTGPTSLLDVYGGAIRARRTSDQYIEIKSVDASGGHITGHSREGNKKPLHISSLHDGSGSPAGETRLQFRVGNESSPIEAMRIVENGDVGIGTTNPQYPLDVNGKCISGVDCSAPGDYATVSGGRDNTASGVNATVSGGHNNTASLFGATVSGGSENSASYAHATVCGGSYNTASGSAATVCGGYQNSASGARSFAAGSRAKANHDGTFVWSDTASTSDFVSTGDYQFLIRATGGVGIGTNNPGGWHLAVNGHAAKLGGGSWFNFSDGRLKTLGDSYERGLSDVTKLNPVHYSYKEGNALELPTGQEHVGLVAQDVQTAIPEAVEENRDGYLMVNNDPILWAMVNAIKELKAENDLLRDETDSLWQENDSLRRDNDSLRQETDSLRQGFGTLTHRLETLERSMVEHKLASTQAAGS